MGSEVVEKRVFAEEKRRNSRRRERLTVYEVDEKANGRGLLDCWTTIVAACLS